MNTPQPQPSTSKHSEETPNRRILKATRHLPKSPTSNNSLSKNKKQKSEDTLTNSLVDFIKFKQNTVNNVENIPPNKKQLMSFFDDIAETVPDIEQAVIKHDIFNMVNAKYIEILNKNSSALSQNQNQGFSYYQFP